MSSFFRESVNNNFFRESVPKFSFCSSWVGYRILGSKQFSPEIWRIPLSFKEKLFANLILTPLRISSSLSLSLSLTLSFKTFLPIFYHYVSKGWISLLPFICLALDWSFESEDSCLSSMEMFSLINYLLSSVFLLLEHLLNTRWMLKLPYLASLLFNCFFFFHSLHLSHFTQQLR